MNRYKLYYADINLKDDVIPCFEFKKHRQMVEFIDQNTIKRWGECVWLIAKDDFTDIFISERPFSIQDYLLTKSLWQTTGEFFLQEYNSFQEAYKAALNMTETSPLCYP